MVGAWRFELALRPSQAYYLLEVLPFQSPSESCTHRSSSVRVARAIGRMRSTPRHASVLPRYGLNGSSLLACVCRGPYSGSALGCCRYFRMVLRSQPVSLLIPWILIPCRCSSFSSCTSRPLSKSRNLLRVEWAPVYHARGGDFSTGTMGIFAPALTRNTNSSVESRTA